MAGIKDVAKLAGVAPSTVSLVLNHKGYVSVSTRKKVEDAVRELSYTPSTIARNLSLNRTNLIGVIVPEIRHPFYGELVHELEQVLYEHGLKMLLCSSVNKENAEEEFVSMLQSRTMDGIIVGTHSLKLDIYEGITRPIVAFDRVINDDIPVIHANHIQGGELAAQTMLEAGCRHIVQIIGSQEVKSPANAYHIAFENKVRAAGAIVETVEMARNMFGEEGFYRAVDKALTEYPHVDGVFGADLIISAALAVAKKHKKRIPEDIKAVAYDGTDITRLSSLQLTAVVQPLTKLAEIAVEAIVKMIEGKNIGVLPNPELTLQRGMSC